MKDKQRLYLMSNPTGLKKVGIALNPDKRKRQIELTSGHKVDIIRCWQVIDATAREAEQYIHRLYARRRVEGEWFTQMSVQDVEYAGYDMVECNHNGTIRRKHESV